MYVREKRCFSRDCHVVYELCTPRNDGFGRFCMRSRAGAWERVDFLLSAGLPRRCAKQSFARPPRKDEGEVAFPKAVLKDGDRGFPDDFVELGDDFLGGESVGAGEGAAVPVVLVEVCVVGVKRRFPGISSKLVVFLRGQGSIGRIVEISSMTLFSSGNGIFLRAMTQLFSGAMSRRMSSLSICANCSSSMRSPSSVLRFVERGSRLNEPI